MLARRSETGAGGPDDTGPFEKLVDTGAEGDSLGLYQTLSPA